MGRVKAKKVNSGRARTAKRALGERPAPFYPHGTPMWEGKDKALVKAEASEHRRLVAEGRRVVADPARRAALSEALGRAGATIEAPTDHGAPQERP